MYKIMTPGPTQVAENVRLARSLECTNPDLDEDFVEFYKETCDMKLPEKYQFLDYGTDLYAPPPMKPSS